MKLRPHFLIPLTLLATPALAKVDAACEPVIAAAEAKVAAPAFHDRKQMEGMTMEMIKLGEDLYANTGGGWRHMTAAASKSLGGFRKGVDSGEISLSQCKKLGRETVGGRSTQVYQFTSTAGGMTGTGKVWVGDDGLPYRETAEGSDGTVSYTGVTAPAVKKRKSP